MEKYASALLDKAIEIAKEHKCYKVSLETGSNKESTLNFYRNNGFMIDEKHSCLKRLQDICYVNLWRGFVLLKEHVIYYEIED